MRVAAWAAAEALEARTLFATISGTVYWDLDYDGARDAEEPPVDAATVYWDQNFNLKYDAGEASDITDPSGHYDVSVSYTPYTSQNLRVAEEARFASAGGLYFHVDEGNTPHIHYDVSTDLPVTPNATSTNDDVLGDCDCQCGWHPPQRSPDPVRYGDGMLDEGATDLLSAGYGMPWTVSRSWSNLPGYADNTVNGNGWAADSTPMLIKGVESLGVAAGASTLQWFDAVSPTQFKARGRARDTLTYVLSDEGGGSEYVYTSAADGTQLRFYDLHDATLPAAQRGAFKSQQAPGAERIRAVSHNAAGRPTELQRSVTVGGTTTVEHWEYHYIGDPTAEEAHPDADDPNFGKLDRVKLYRTDGTYTTDVRQVAYDYYEDYTSTAATVDKYGNLGDLRTAEVKDASGTVLDTWYYRYYRDVDDDASLGYVGALKYIVTPQGFARLRAGLSGSPLEVDDSTLRPYADKRYQYDGNHRVERETVAGAGQSPDTAPGLGTITYSYTNSFLTPGYNVWNTKTVETHPDGNQVVVYTNYTNQVMLRATLDTSEEQSFSQKRLATFYRYDPHGRVDMIAHPSAFDPDDGDQLWDEFYADLLHDLGGGNYEYLGNDFGQIDYAVYWGNQSNEVTDASETVAGNVEGLLKSVWTKRGDVDDLGTTADNRIQQSETLYKVKSVTPVGGVPMTVELVGAVSIFPAAVPGTPGPAQRTDYDYTYLANSVRVASATTRRPIVYGPTDAGHDDHNGPGGTTQDADVTVFDAYGQPVWTKDAGGFLTYLSWDPVTGAPLKAIEDVDASQTGTFTGLPSLPASPTSPTSPWSTPTGGGRHLTTTYKPDALGRTTRVVDPNGHATYTVYDDPGHAVLTFRGWDATNHTTTGPVELAREYRPVANAPSDQREVYAEVLTTSAAPTYDSYGEPIGVAALDRSNVLSLTRTRTNKAGQVTEVDEYFTLDGLVYAPERAVLAVQTPTPTPTPPPATASNDSTSGHYHKTEYGYNKAGLNNSVKSSAGTITRTVFDGRGNPASIWVGTDDTGATDLAPNGSGGTNNMVRLSETEYDESCGCGNSSGDGKPTKVTVYPGGGADARVTENYYDWRGRLVATKGGVQGTEAAAVQRPIAYADLDNLGRPTTTYLYDGDGVPVTETAGVPDKPAAPLRAVSDTLYDEQGRVYRTRTHSVDPSSGVATTAALTTNYFYDRRGNLIKTAAPGGLVSKTAYNGLGWATATYATDGGGDADWSDAGTVAGDRVLEQAEYAYDGVGNVTLATARQRFHDTPYTGPLGGPASGGTTPQARVSYAVTYYDAADRPTANVDLGTASGAAVTARPPAVPGRAPVAPGTADGGTTTTLVDAPLAGATDAYVGYTLTVTGGTDAGRSAMVTGYNATTHTLTFSPALPAAVDGTSAYALTPPLVTTYGYAADEVQRVTLGGSPTGGSFTLSFGGNTTVALAYNATAAVVQSALQALASVGAGNAQVTGDNGGPYYVRFVGGKAGSNVQAMTAAGSLTGGTSPMVAVVTVSQGGDNGRAQTTTDPRGLVAKSDYDLLGRTVRTVAGYADFVPSAADDQTTLYTYDGDGHVLKMTADVPGVDQTTQYVYGVTAAGGSAVTSNDLLLEVRYPDKTTGVPGTGTADKERYAYSAVGQARTFTDKVGNVHAYGYDVLGRQTTDEVTTLIAGVDGTVRRLETGYGTQGMADTFTSLGQERAASAYGHTGTTATVTLSGHGLANGDTVVVTGASQAQYNGTFTVTVVNSSTFTYMMPADPGGTPTGTLLFRKLVNQVKDVFNGFGQLTTEYQDHKGAVNTATSPKVQYTYSNMAGGANHSRLTKVTYPNGRVLRYEYGVSGTLDEKVGRVSYLADDASGTVGTHLVDYGYLGLSTIVDKNRPQPGIDTTYVAQGAETPADAGDKYTGLDRFGRVIDQRSVKAGTAVDRFQYGYDADSNVQDKNNLVSSTHSELYHTSGPANGYDKLNRLTNFSRGALTDFDTDGALDTVSSPGTTNSWTLDALGNWTAGGGDTTRAHDARNELTGSTAGFCTTSYGYDANGSLTQSNNTTSGGNVALQRYTYDAWGRQATACGFTSGVCTTSTTYGYDALGRRVKQVLVKDPGVPAGGNGTRTVATSTEDRYYSAAWQVLDDQCATTCVTTCYVSGTSCGTSSCTNSVDDQYVWGLGYVDDLVLRDRAAVGVSALDPSFNGTGRATTDFASGTDEAHAVAVQDDGKVVVAGTTTSGGNSDLALARYKADGTPDNTFDGDGKATANLATLLNSTGEGWGAIDLEASGNILVAGYVTVGGNKDFLLARYLPNGTLDTSFDSDGLVQTAFTGSGDDFARAVLEQPDGKVVVAGDAVINTGGSTTRREIVVARYTAAGALDTTFGDADPAHAGQKLGWAALAVGSGAADGYGLVLQPDGKLVVVGDAVYGGSTTTDMVAARLNADGSLDTAGFGLSGSPGVAWVDFEKLQTHLYADHAYAVALAPDGSIVVAGDANPTGSGAASAVAKLTAAGVLDLTFNPAGDVPGALTRTQAAVARAVSVDGIGRAVVAGSVARTGGTGGERDFVTYRLNPDGQGDTTFGASGTVQTNFPTNKDDAAWAAAVTATSVVVAGGSGGDFAVARYVPNGSTVNQRVYAIQDANYNVTSLADVSGTVVERFEYDPYGRASVMTQAWGSTTDTYDWSVRFQGSKQEAATGAYALRHRDYDPTLGRWLEEDPIRYAGGGMNIYEGFASSPAMSVDPNGLASEKEPLAGHYDLEVVYDLTFKEQGIYPQQREDTGRKDGSGVPIYRDVRAVGQTTTGPLEYKGADISIDDGPKGCKRWKLDKAHYLLHIKITVLHPRRPLPDKDHGWPGTNGGGWKKVLYHEYLHAKQIEKAVRKALDEKQVNLQGSCQYGIADDKIVKGGENYNKSQLGGKNLDIINAGDAARDHPPELFKDVEDNWNSAELPPGLADAKPPIDTKKDPDPTKWPGAVTAGGK